ncbi:MAG: D-alanyl-D-alanine carboxypeptidase [Roseovarius sp.]|uniref:D-alanyl-D-alanine carboxypeptidase family protein n=1 Tax=Roseovarius sp. TaxID=1486281 RepID=UPI001B3DFA08|nr:D-alanyl-D-alanine carboxypeptidase family protein [Roseovarius sp.]MBQ0749276.1 D-alanyl-D-alanine carboxypeptidase [Roseovarius sp.]MBQ0810112.1 D-alanyl-D-alanine carboxypeptidase [Roseovarius sp.]
MKTRGRQPVRWGLVAFATFWMLVIVPLSAAAAPYAAFVMDARNGEVLYANNADTRLHPASLTKMMTLYVVFEAIENGEIGLDDKVVISRNAASEPPSKLGVRAGSSIALRYLIRAAAVKSANDAATALGEAIEGSEAQFARRMNRTAEALGMTRTTFKNAHGLTENGHLSTARDMSILGRHLFYDFPQYYNLFSRITTDAGVTSVSHTNRRLLEAYRGADGIKTGYTRAAGFNLTASAERGGERIIATVFGGQSTASRNAKVAELLDLGFNKAPTQVAVHRPARPPYLGKLGTAPVMIAAGEDRPSVAAKTVRLTTAAAVVKSLRPQSRPMATAQMPVIAARDDIERALLAAQEIETATIAASDTPEDSATVTPDVRPEQRPTDIVLASAPAPEPEPEVVTRVSTSGGRHWGINVGRYSSEYKARQMLLQTALNEMATLDGSLRKVVQRPAGFDANFMGMTRESADLACRRLQAKKVTCFMIGPS